MTSVGSNAIRVMWTAVSGAAKYTVRYSTTSSFSSFKDREATETSMVIEGLTTGTTYYVELAAVDSSGATSSFSSFASAKPAHQFAAPSALLAENVGGTAIELTWPNVPFSPGYRVGVYSSGKPTVYFSTITERVTLTGLKKGTLYYISAYVEQPAMNGLPALIMSPRSAEVQVTTSTYDLAAPSDLALVGQSSSSVKLAWTAPDGMQADWQYQVKRALNVATTTEAAWSGPIAGTSTTLSGLTADTAYYVRVRVIDSAGVQRSDLSDSIMAKTIVQTGLLTGTISGAPARDVVAAAYDSSGELVQQVDLTKDGVYSFVVRPGSYRVQAINIGTGNFTSVWASATGSGAMVPSAAQPLSVTLNGTTSAPEVKLSSGGIVKGRIVEPSGEPVPDVDVTALSAVTSEREVMAQAMTDAAGNYTLKGLSTGDYWLRIKYSTDGFLTRSVFVSVQEGQTLTTDATLDLASFRKSYGSYVKGTKTVGKTVSVTATAWLAGSYPTTRATMTVQWKRNGVPIKGATSWTYKLTSSDKGKKLSVTATATRYGYQTGSSTSSSYTVN
ncbi:MAG: fibronectin type III domain-containing protein [Propionibacteriaceae bacterium]|nr:fibronectin type III domain-containing protein [Propionibacteriaceae bacterium]